MQQALANLRTALAAADVVKVTALIVHHSEERLAIFSAALRAILSDMAPALHVDFRATPSAAGHAI